MSKYSEIFEELNRKPDNKITLGDIDLFVYQNGAVGVVIRGDEFGNDEVHISHKNAKDLGIALRNLFEETTTV